MPGAGQGCAKAPRRMPRSPQRALPCPERAPRRCLPAEGGPSEGADPPGTGTPVRSCPAWPPGAAVRPPPGPGRGLRSAADAWGEHRTPTGTGSPSGGPPAALIGWAGVVLSPSSGRDRAAERLWSAGKGQSCWHLPQISARVPPEMCVCPPPSPCLGHKAAGPVGLGGGSGSSVPCTGWAQSGGGQEQPPGIRALISAPAGGRSPPLGETSGDSRLSHVLFTCTHRNLPSAQPPALMLWRHHRLCLVPEGSPADIGAAALRSLGWVRPWPLGFREVGSRVMGQDCG